MFEKLKKENPGLKLYSVHDREFETYGKVLTLDAGKLKEAAAALPMPAEGSVYEASVPSLEKTALFDVLEKEVYGEMPIQIGDCRGFNNRLNGLEWHIGSEINVGVTPFVLLLAHQWDFHDGFVDSADVKAFYVAENDVIEVYGTTLHFCPCQIDEKGFNSIVVLPKGTNVPLETETHDPLLFRKNKWLVSHVDNEGLIARGVVKGIRGENLTVKGVTK